MTTWTSLAGLHYTELRKDYDVVSDALAALYNSTEELRCWKSEVVPVGEVDRYQVLDDLHATQRVNRFRRVIRGSLPMPPIVLVHGLIPNRGIYSLIDGCHRFNAAHREGVGHLPAWVAHIGCCGGPSADLHDADSTAS